MRSATGWKSLVLSICVAFAAAACGDDDPSKDPNNTTANNTTTNNTTNNTSNNDLCADVNCTAEPAECDGDEVVEFTSEGCDPETGMCEFTESRTDCTASGEVCMNGQCVTEDLCAGVTCEPEAPTCDGDTVVQIGAGMCDPDTGMCSQGEETRTDCTDSDQICMNGACVDDTSLCADVTCDQPDTQCQMQELVEYSGDGVCDEDTGECDFSAVESRTNCEDSGEICVNAACVADDDDSLNPGDLVITEFMQNPSAVSDADGEWFEIYNATARTIDIEGIVLDDGSNQLTVTGTGGSFPVPGFSYLVVGKNDITDDQDSDYNGGLSVDIIFDNMSLSNSSDTVTIFAADGTTVIDEVSWDDGATFPDGNGAAAMFGGEFDPATDDNADGSFWCKAITPYGAGDLGTPGSANDACPQPTVTTIYDIQDQTSADAANEGFPLILEDVVVTAIDGGNLFVQEPAGGQYSGIYVTAFDVDTSTLSVGDVIRLEGSFTEDFSFPTRNLTTFVTTAVVPANMQMAIAPEVVSSEELATEVSAEPWEGVLIQVVEAGITSSNPDGPDNDFDEFRVDGSVRVASFFYDYNAGTNGDPANCWIFDEITGPLNYSFGNFKIVPRDANDFVVADATLTSSGATGTSMVGMGGLNFSPSNICIDAGGTVDWTWSSGLHDVESRDAGATMPAATKVLDSPDLMMAGDTFSFTFNDAGSYRYLCSYHPSTMTGQVVVLEP